MGPLSNVAKAMLLRIARVLGVISPNDQQDGHHDEQVEELVLRAQHLR